MLRAAVVWTIHHTAKRAREARSDDARKSAIKAATLSSMTVATRKELQRLVTAAWMRRQGARQGERAEVEWAAWREARWIVTGRNGASIKILEGGFGTGSGVPGEDAQRASALPCERRIYTDGAWNDPNVDAEAAEAMPLAGYGAVEFQVTRPDRQAIGEAFPLGQYTTNGFDASAGQGVITWVDAGMVETDHREPDYIGAEAHTNNTGELTAMHCALRRAAGVPSGRERTSVESDSLYTIHMTTGKWLPRKRRNRELISRLRGIWRDIQRKRPGEVTLRHVRSHILVPGNELADELADGRGSMNSTHSARRWMRELVRKLHDRSGADQTTNGVTAAASRNGADQADGGQPAGPQGPGTLGDRVGVG